VSLTLAVAGLAARGEYWSWPWPFGHRSQFFGPLTLEKND
jgi:hypothetical protein